jgi:hypothetical protein
MFKLSEEEEYKKERKTRSANSHYTDQDLYPEKKKFLSADELQGIAADMSKKEVTPEQKQAYDRGFEAEMKQKEENSGEN